nr:ABC transporter ATP-binding protein [Nanoarchaeum sp.]
MELVIKVENLHRKFGSFTALRDVNFNVYRGEIFGLLGPNGAGKTTTIKVLLGLLSPTSGIINVLGYNPINDEFAFRKRIAALLENPGIYEDLSVYDNLNLYAKIYRIEDSIKRIPKILDFVGLLQRMHEISGRLSLGMKKKLAIGRLLLHDPELLFLDEPTSGLDPIFQKEIRELIQNLARDGKTIFLNSHNLYEVQQICTRVAFIKDGNFIGENTLEYFYSKLDNLKREVVFKTLGDMEKANSCLINLGQATQYPYACKIELLLTDPMSNSELCSLMAEQGIFVKIINNGVLTLEDVFFKLMKV